MRVTCPKCQCKGMIDTAPLLSKAHVTCARCGAAYEALLVDGLVETTLPADQSEAQPVEFAAAQLEPETCLMVESDEVLALPQAVEKVEPKDEPATVLEILEPAQPELLIEPKPTATPVLTGNPSAASTPQAQPANTLEDSGGFVMPADYEPQFSRVEIERQAEHDKYSLGVRLMRVSPLWLLICGLSFIALVVALNGLTGSAEQISSASSHPTRANTTGNHATNQSARSAAPDQTAKALSSAATVNKPEHAPEVAQPSAAVAQSNAGVQQTAQAAAAQPAPQVETPRTQVEAKPTPAPLTQPNAAGKFTLQVGSYNTPVEANERAAHLRSAGFAAQVVAVELPKRGTWYRVQTGRFGDRAEAARAGAELRAKGAAESFIVSEVAAH